MAQVLHKSDLGSDAEIESGRIKEGGFGVVYKLNHFRLGNDPTPLAYKEFTKDVDEQVRSASQAVEFRGSLSPLDQQNLDTYTAWPRVMVQGTPSGLVMPLIPADFFRSMTDDETGRPVLKPLAMNWLAANRTQISAAGLDLREVTRLEREMLLAKLCYAIGRLHRHGWVFGDLSLSNAVFALDSPRLMLVDCDGAAPEFDPLRSQGNTPFYEPPECLADPKQLQDSITDVYKLGLCILRCLAPGKGAGTTRRADRLTGTYSAEFVKLIGRAVSSDRAMRPTAKDLYVFLSELVEERIEVPEVEAWMEQDMCLRGQDVRLHWRVSGAESATISAPNNYQVTVDLSVHPDGYSFLPMASGPVTLTVGNDFGGAVEVDLGRLELFEIPAFTPAEIHLPPVSFTPLPVFPPGPFPAGTNRPLVSVGDPGRPDPMSLAGLVASSAHLGAPGGTSLAEGAVGAASALTAGVTEAAGRLTSDMLSLLSDSTTITLRDLESAMRREVMERNHANEAQVRGSEA
jgi:hypothetical protein